MRRSCPRTCSSCHACCPLRQVRSCPSTCYSVLKRFPAGHCGVLVFSEARKRQQQQCRDKTSSQQSSTPGLQDNLCHRQSKTKYSDVDAEVALGTVMGPFQSHPTIPCRDPKDSTSTSWFLNMHRVALLLGLCGIYMCLTAADHTRILVCTLMCHETLGSQDNLGWKGH